MGFPCTKVHSLYRNPLPEVQKFFDCYHKDSYKVYNICTEKKYDPAKFDGRLGYFPFEDHNVPSMKMIHDFCVDIHQFLAESPDNVVAVHCRAGKGRTGMMVACYLVFCGDCSTAKEALDYFARQRTTDMVGCRNPSQRRFVEYYAHFVSQYFKLGRPFSFFPGKPIIVTKVRIHTTPNFDYRGGCGMYLSVFFFLPSPFSLLPI